jgi:hypothetical protein
VAEQIRARGTGHTFRTNRFVPMPDKIRGKHRWIVLATYHTTRESLTAARRGEDVHLDMENLVYLTEGCVDCEQIFPAPEPCPAGDQWTDLGEVTP